MPPLTTSFAIFVRLFVRYPCQKREADLFFSCGTEYQISEPEVGFIHELGPWQSGSASLTSPPPLPSPLLCPFYIFHVPFIFGLNSCKTTSGCALDKSKSKCSTQPMTMPISFPLLQWPCQDPLLSLLCLVKQGYQPAPLQQ